jgi:hypothetical protein
MSIWGLVMSRPHRLVSAQALLSSEQPPTSEARRGATSPDTFEFSVKLQDVAGKVGGSMPSIHERTTRRVGCNEYSTF